MDRRLQGAFFEFLAAFDRSKEVPSLATMEMLYTCWVLEQCGGNRSETARRLGVDRGTLVRKLKTFPPDLVVVSQWSQAVAGLR